MSESVKPEPFGFHLITGQPLYTADQITAAHAAGVRAGMLRAAQMVESMTARERWISGAINSQQAKPCKIAAAIRAEAEREGEK
jgi:hypothetical protein